MTTFKLVRRLCHSRSLFAANVHSRSVSIGESIQEDQVCQKPEEIKTSKPNGWDDALPFEEIPGPKPLPIIGNMGRMFVGDLKADDFYFMAEKLHEKYGRICSMRKFFNGDNYIFLYDARDIEYLFRNEGEYPIREIVPSLKYYKEKVRPEWFGGSTGLASEQGPRWHELRMKVNPIMMQPRNTLSYIKNMDIVAQEFIEIMRKLSKQSSKQEMPEDFINELNKWALESICLIAIDKRLGCLDPNIYPETQKFITGMVNMFDMFFKLDMQFSLWRYFPTKDYREFVKLFDFLSQFILKQVNEATEKIQKSQEKKHIQDQSVFERLLSVNKTFAFLTAMDMFVAGIDTVTKSTSNVMFFLAKNPRAQEALRDEMKRLLPKKDSPFTKDVFQKASYLKAVIKETARIAPLGPGHFRRAAKDLVIAGYRIPKGTQVITNNLILCMKEFPKPREFIPERWLRSNNGELSHKNVSPFVSLPFGFGPRICVGKRVADLEMATVLGKMIRNFKLEWHHPDVTFKQKIFYGFEDPFKITVKDL